MSMWHGTEQGIMTGKVTHSDRGIMTSSLTGRSLALNVYSDYTSMRHSMCKFIKDASVSHQMYNVS